MRVARGHNSTGTDSLPWALKRPNNVTSTFFNTVHMLPKDLRFEHGAPNLLTVPGAIQPCYVPGMGRKIEVQETIHKNFDFCQAIFAPPSKWRPWHVPCLPYPRYATA